MATNKEAGQILKETGQTVETGRTIETGQTIAANANEPYLLRAERVRSRQLRQGGRLGGAGPASGRGGPTLAERFVSALENAASALRESGAAFKVTESEQTPSQISTGHAQSQVPTGQTPASPDYAGGPGTPLTDQPAWFQQALAPLQTQLSSIQAELNTIGPRISNVVANAISSAVEGLVSTPAIASIETTAPTQATQTAQTHLADVEKPFPATLSAADVISGQPTSADQPTETQADMPPKRKRGGRRRSASAQA